MDRCPIAGSIVVFWWSACSLRALTTALIVLLSFTLSSSSPSPPESLSWGWWFLCVTMLGFIPILCNLERENFWSSSLFYYHKTQKDREKQGSDLKILPEKILPTSQIILYLFNKILIGSQRKFIYSHFFSS